MPQEGIGEVTPLHRYEVTLIREDDVVDIVIPLTMMSEAEALQRVNALSLTYAVELRDHGRLVIALPLRKP